MLVADDATGLRQADVLPLLELLPDVALVLVEIAIDFPQELALGVSFVMAHMLFGKSRYAGRKLGIVWFGTRRSAKFVRAYWKVSIRCLRIELELHSVWLRRHKIADIFDFAKLPGFIVSRHIRVSRLNWPAIHSAISRSGANRSLALRNLRWQARDLYATLRFLRREIGLRNTHRFLIPLKTNRTILEALNAWARQWHRRPFRLRGSATPIASRQWKWSAE